MTAGRARTPAPPALGSAIGRGPPACDPGEAWIKASAIQADAATRQSGERSDLDGRVQEVSGSNPLSSMFLENGLVKQKTGTE
jgi:hypothetical protein